MCVRTPQFLLGALIVEVPGVASRRRARYRRCATSRSTTQRTSTSGPGNPWTYGIVYGYQVLSRTAPGLD